MQTYMLKIYYMNRKINPYEYQTHEFLIMATPNTVEDVAKKEIADFNELNPTMNVEQYNIYLHIKGETLKGAK